MNIRRALFPALACLLLLSFVSVTLAEMSDRRAMSGGFSTVEQMERATVSAGSILHRIDAGGFDVAWDQASDVFKKIISKAEWLELVREIRLSRGAVYTRHLINRSFKREIPNVPPGPYVVLKYDLTFRLARDQSHLETIIMRLDEDNFWRLAGYYLK